MLITIFLGIQIKHLRFEHNLEDFFNKNYNFYQFNQSFFKQFNRSQGKSNGEKKIAIILSNDKEVSYDFLSKLNNFSQDLKQIDSIKSQDHVLKIPLFIFTPLGRYPYKIFHLDEPSRFASDLQNIKNNKDLAIKYLSNDYKSTLVYITLKKNQTIDDILAIKQEIEKKAEPYEFESIHFYNNELTNYYVVNKLKEKSALLTIIAVILIILILSFFTRSFLGVILPLVIVLITVIWIIGTICLLDIPLNVLTIAIPVIVGVISLSDVIHLVSRFNEEKTHDKNLKIKLTEKDMLRAIILTSVTTSLGFISLIPSNIQVFIEFGFFSTLGVLYAFVLAYWLLPILLYYAKPVKVKNYLKYITPQRIYIKPTLIVSSIIIVLAIIGVSLVKNQSFIYDDLNAQDEASKTVKLMAEDFYGIRDLSLAIEFKNGQTTDFENIVLIDSIEKKVNRLYGQSNYLGLTFFIKQMNRALHGGNFEYYRVPTNEKDFKRVMRKLNKNKKLVSLDGFISKDKKSTFLYGQIHDPGSYDIDLKNKELVHWVNTNFSDQVTLTPTGGSNIIDQTNFTVTKTMMLSLTFIMLVIMVLIMVLFKSVSLGFISLIPNMLPLIIIMGVVGWFNMGLSVTISIVFTIVFGIAVDDTIHFLSRYRIEKAKGISNLDVVENCIKTTGSAISLTTIILIAGFGTLLFSDFRANFTTGLLVSIGLLVAVLCDLFLFPVLLYIMKKK